LTDARRAGEMKFSPNYSSSLPLAANGIQEAVGSIPISSTRSLEFLGVTRGCESAFRVLRWVNARRSMAGNRAHPRSS
jgi:hypothetical protein